MTFLFILFIYTRCIIPAYQVLLLSHPHKRTRDTQVYASKFKLVRTRFVGLRNLVRQELGIVIQNGEHSSVRDAVSGHLEIQIYIYLTIVVGFTSSR